MIRPAPFRQSDHVLRTLSQTHRRAGIVPSSDASLRYVLPIPRTWGRVCGLAASPAAGRSELLGIFAPTPDLRGPRIIISVTRLRWDVDPLEIAISSTEIHPAEGDHVVFVGHAYSPNLRALTELTSHIEVGPLRKTIAVVGDRKWVPSFFGVVMSRPVAFERMPILYERAFGGRSPRLDERNPVGTWLGGDL